MIAAYSRVAVSMHLVYQFLLMDITLPIHSWFSRVQSASNAGDDPSRLKFSQVISDWPQAKWLEPASAVQELDLAILKAHGEDRSHDSK